MESRQLSYLQIHPEDNVLVALRDLPKGFVVDFDQTQFALQTSVAAKHKFTISQLTTNSEVYMYGVLVGKMNFDVPIGTLLTTENLRHASSDFKLGSRKLQWHKPDVSRWKSRTFQGYHRTNGSVGTANYWLVIPLVFCENRNVLTLKAALEDK